MSDWSFIRLESHTGTSSRLVRRKGRQVSRLAADVSRDTSARSVSAVEAAETGSRHAGASPSGDVDAKQRNADTTPTITVRKSG
jgi:hypothetical protein